MASLFLFMCVTYRYFNVDNILPGTRRTFEQALQQAIRNAATNPGTFILSLHKRVKPYIFFKI